MNVPWTLQTDLFYAHSDELLRRMHVTAMATDYFLEEHMVNHCQEKYISISLPWITTA